MFGAVSLRLLGSMMLVATGAAAVATGAYLPGIVRAAPGARSLDALGGHPPAAPLPKPLAALWRRCCGPALLLHFALAAVAEAVLAQEPAPGTPGAGRRRHCPPLRASRTLRRHAHVSLVPYARHGSCGHPHGASVCPSHCLLSRTRPR